MKGKLNKILKSYLKLFHFSANNNNLFGHYLAGLIEGDGSIIVPKSIRNQKGKLLYPVVKITFVDKDAPLANKIKEILNGGTLVYPKNSKYLNLLFQDLNTIQKIAVLLNGKMRTPKIEALYRLIDWINARSNEKVTNVSIIKLGLDNSSLGNNPWLTGFMEADANFFCSFNLNSKKIAETVKTYMRLSQKQMYKKDYNTNSSDLKLNINSNFKLMDKVRNFLNIKNVNEIKRIRKDFVELSYEVRTTKKESCDILINYLSKYPLFSSKHQDFLNWKDIYYIRLYKKYKTSEGTSQLISLKNSMNTKRTQFNWDSLNNFYHLM
uniref:hypothetical protein n=1 Tax=Gonatophragmium mori TaxID=2966219 RepID=UPI0023D8394F|nr:hypothetical protein P2Z26_mgp24 [Gonatophragmium mori]WCZ71156.1 hypothetical protein [Gonatophragmium mori]